MKYVWSVISMSLTTSLISVPGMAPHKRDDEVKAERRTTESTKDKSGKTHCASNVHSNLPVNRVSAFLALVRVCALWLSLSKSLWSPWGIFSRDLWLALSTSVGLFIYETNLIIAEGEYFAIHSTNMQAVLQVVVHPLVLLSVVDHFNRVSKTQNVKRVVGVLLGSMKPDRTLDIANSFAGSFLLFLRADGSKQSSGRASRGLFPAEENF